MEVWTGKTTQILNQWESYYISPSNPFGQIPRQKEILTY